MKKSILLLALFASFTIFASAQKGRKLPSVQVKTMNGDHVNTSTFSNNGKPMIISFWATWCAPCKRELNTISDLYPDWQKKTGVKLIAISIDDSRSESRVLPYVNGSDWDYDVYIDDNQEFKRAMNVNNVPDTFLVDGNGNIVWQHNNYAPGDEQELYQKLLELVQKH